MTFARLTHLAHVALHEIGLAHARLDGCVIGAPCRITYFGADARRADAQQVNPGAGATARGPSQRSTHSNERP